MLRLKLFFNKPLKSVEFGLSEWRISNNHIQQSRSSISNKALTQTKRSKSLENTRHWRRVFGRRIANLQNLIFS